MRVRSALFAFVVFCLAAMPARAMDVEISEFFPNPEGVDSGREWVELHNTADQTVSLEGWRLEDLYGSTRTYMPHTTLQPNEYRVFWQNDTKITLNNDAEQLKLTSADGETFITEKSGVVEEGMSFALIAGAWYETAPTPGAAPTLPSPSPYPSPSTSPSPSSIPSSPSAAFSCESGSEPRNAQPLPTPSIRNIQRNVSYRYDLQRKGERSQRIVIENQGQHAINAKPVFNRNNWIAGGIAYIAGGILFCIPFFLKRQYNVLT